MGNTSHLMNDWLNLGLRRRELPVHIFCDGHPFSMPISFSDKLLRSAKIACAAMCERMAVLLYSPKISWGSGLAKVFNDGYGS